MLLLVRNKSSLFRLMIVLLGFVSVAANFPPQTAIYFDARRNNGEMSRRPGGWNPTLAASKEMSFLPVVCLSVFNSVVNVLRPDSSIIWQVRSPHVARIVRRSRSRRRRHLTFAGSVAPPCGAGARAPRVVGTVHCRRRDIRRRPSLGVPAAMSHDGAHGADGHLRLGPGLRPVCRVWDLHGRRPPIAPAADVHRRLREGRGETVRECWRCAHRIASRDIRLHLNATHWFPVPSQVSVQSLLTGVIYLFAAVVSWTTFAESRDSSVAKKHAMAIADTLGSNI